MGLKEHTLIVFKNLREDELIQKASFILENLNDISVYKEVYKSYYYVQGELLHLFGKGKILGTYWEDYICGLIADSFNPFSIQCEKGSLPEQLKPIVKDEIRIIQRIYSINWDEISQKINGASRPVASITIDVENEPIHNEISLALRSETIEIALEGIKKYYYSWGCGIFGKYHGFIWTGELQGIKKPDPVKFTDLIGYDLQKNKIIENIKGFMGGKPFNNMLLYGDKGTGKSSSIKALLNEYGKDKLRLISCNKEMITSLPELIESIEERNYKFIIFIDDISFEDNDDSYKAFKSALEGNIRSQSKNTLIAVTSNRKNLVREVWTDRNNQNDISIRDSLQEKSSLADRFGLRITFSAPNKSEYLTIVKGLAEQEGLDIDEEILFKNALEWEIRNNGRSGRTARQFMNNLLGRI